MSDESMRSGQVSSTPEGGPAAEGVPASEPGAGQVQTTPEAAPLAEDEELIPPTWREHMDGPILGMDDAPSAPPPAASPAAAREEPAATESRTSRSSTDQAPMSGMDTASGRAGSADDELRKWPPYSGMPVSEVRWDALRYAAPVVAQAEKLSIKAIDLTGRGLSRLARFLETRRRERDAEQNREPGDTR